MSILKRKHQRHPEEEVDSEGSWAISYGDMITLLLTFFILFFNVNSRDQEQKMAIQEALLQQLKALQTPSIQIGQDRKPAGIEETIVAEWGGKTYRTGERVVVEFPAISFFDKGKVEIRKEAVDKLQQFAKLYLPYMGQNMLSVRAFTDTLKVSEGKRFKDNLELSALRAISAMRVLEKHGIPLRLMRITGNGEFANLMNQIEDANFRSNGDPLARKVVLVIEPNTKEKI